MSIVSAILVYLMLWMIIFFISLPIGINVSKTFPLTYLLVSLVENNFIKIFIKNFDI